MFNKLSIKELQLKNKKALIRVDFNVPLENGIITDNTRIVASLDSIRYVLDQGGSVILMSHLGRPKSKVNPEFSLTPCAKELSGLLNKKVIMTSDCLGKQTEEIVAHLQPGEIVMLENLRFYAAEEEPEKDPLFAQKLASYGDVYINDAFGTAHRAHSSVTEITKYFPQRSAAGFLMEKEIEFLGNALQSPQRPFYALIGGAKISSKLGILESLLKNVDGLVIAGAMAFTFLKAQGYPVGSSLVEDNLIPEALKIIQECQKRNVRLILSQDVYTNTEINAITRPTLKEFPKGLEKNEMGLDIGPKTIATIQNTIKDAKTILWNGPFGVTEVEQYAQGTLAIATYLSKLPATKIIGGGDSIAAIQKLGVEKNFSHISTGGGACLEFIEFGSLPGVEALSSHEAAVHV